MQTNIVSGYRGVPPAAFTATVKQTFEQRLPDGNAIHWSIETMQARDTDGRTLEQRIMGCDIDKDGQPQLRTETWISGSKDRSNLRWATGPGAPGVAYLNHMRPALLAEAPPPIPHPAIQRRRNEMTTEQLGKRFIAGYESTGSRSTETIPAGVEGNDLPIKVVHETWNAQTPDKQHLTLSLINDDPRTGRMVFEVETIALGQPDAAIFSPPPGYTVHDDTPPETPVSKP